MATIRKAESSDIAGIKAVLAVTWLDTYSSFLGHDAIARITTEWHSPEVLAKELGDLSTHCAVCVEDSGQIVGVITAYRTRPAQVLVGRLYVLPDHQRRGIGKALMDSAAQAFPGIQKLSLPVEEKNAKGRAFYRKLGFREVGKRVDDVMGTQLTSIIMERLVQ